MTASRGDEVLREEGLIAQTRGCGSAVTDEAPQRPGILARVPVRNVALVIDVASLEEVPSCNRFLVFDMREGLADRFEPAQINLCYLPLRAEGVKGNRQRLWHRLLRIDGVVLFGRPEPGGISVAELVRTARTPAVSVGALEPMPGIPRVTPDLAAVRATTERRVPCEGPLVSTAGRGRLVLRVRGRGLDGIDLLVCSRFRGAGRARFTASRFKR